MDLFDYSMQNDSELDAFSLGGRDEDREWDQFWLEYSMLNPRMMDGLGPGTMDPDGPVLASFDGSQAMYQHHFGTWPTSIAPAPVLQWPPHVDNLDPQLASSYTDPSLTPPSWTDSSTSTSTPSATSSQTASTYTSSSSSSSSGIPHLYTCTHCRQTFTKRCLLNRHTNTHTKPYACTHSGCHERRATRRDLQRHMDVHAASTAARHLCPEPGCEFAVRGFKRRDNLKRHVEGLHLRGTG